MDVVLVALGGGGVCLGGPQVFQLGHAVTRTRLCLSLSIVNALEGMQILW